MFRKFFQIIPGSLQRLVRSAAFYISHHMPSAEEACNSPDSFPALKNPVLIIGHSNFLNSIGGTEYIVIQMTEDFLRKNQDFIYIYPIPFTSSSFLPLVKAYGIIVNGYDFGFIPKNGLFDFINKVAPSELIVHHWFRWPLNTIKKMATILKVPKTLFAHDFYLRCPLLNDRYQDGKYVSETRFSSWYLRYWRKANLQLLKCFKEIKVPSNFMRESLTELDQKNISSLPPFVPPPLPTSFFKFKIAYVGYEHEMKGYQVWRSLASNSLITRGYDLIHVGSRLNPLPGVKCFNYSFTQNRFSEAASILSQNNVDYVLLWSLVPESFSFTLHESLLTSASIITNPASGNIAAMLKKNVSLGKTFANEYQLVQFLLKEGFKK